MPSEFAGFRRASLPYRHTTREGVTVEVRDVPTLVDPRVDQPGDHDHFYERAVSRRLNQLLAAALATRPSPGSVLTLEYGDQATTLEDPEPDPVSLAIAAAIRESGLTQDEVARRLGVSRPLVSRWVNPRYHGHGIGTLRRLAQALGVPLEVRFGHVSPSSSDAA